MNEYWNKRYRGGVDSGGGSRGSYRKWKWKIINGYVDVKTKSVLDVGCGDLQFLKGRKFGSYLGFDISPYIIAKNQGLRPDLELAVRDVTITHKGQPRYDVVLCMDLLFHIMDENGFVRLLENLNRWTGEYLFVVNWCKNPFPYLKDNYQYFRDLSLYFDWLTDLKLVDTFQRKNDPYNMLYVFRRRKG